MKRSSSYRLGVYSSILILFFSVNQPLLAQLADGGPRVAPGQDVMCLATPEGFEPLQEIWSKGFDKEFVIGGSGMVLRATSGSGHWDVLVGDEHMQWVDQGTLLEDTRFELAGTMDSSAMKQLGYEYFKRDLVVGTLIGSTGQPLHVFGVLTEFGGTFTLENGEPAVAFAPVFLDDDLDLVRFRGEEFAHEVNRGADGGGLALKSQEALYSSEELWSTKSDPACHAQCTETQEGDLSACETTRALCFGVVATGTALCLLSCTGTGPAIAVWGAACLAAEIAAIAVCNNSATNCRRDARREGTACHKDCSGVGGPG